MEMRLGSIGGIQQLRHEPIGLGVGIGLTSCQAVKERVSLFITPKSAVHGLYQTISDERFEDVSLSPELALSQSRALLDAGLVSAHSRQQLGHSLSASSDRLENGNLDALTVFAEHLERSDVSNGHISAFTVRLVDGEDVGDLENTCLDGLNIVTHARDEHDH